MTLGTTDSEAGMTLGTADGHITITIADGTEAGTHTGATMVRDTFQEAKDLITDATDGTGSGQPPEAEA